MKFRIFKSALSVAVTMPLMVWLQPPAYAIFSLAVLVSMVVEVAFEVRK